MLERRDPDPQQLIQRKTPDPGLDTKPAAGDDRPQHRRNIRPPHSKARPGKHRERDAIFGARTAVQDHRHQHDGIAQKDRPIACHQFIPPPISELASI